MENGFGYMLSIQIVGGEASAVKTAANVGLYKRATSLGGVESLIEHRASIEGAGSPCPADLLRLSTGIEDVADLYADLDRALTVGHG
jgi:cystathionine gamma-synthase